MACLCNGMTEREVGLIQEGSRLKEGARVLLDTQSVIGNSTATTLYEKHRRTYSEHILSLSYLSLSLCLSLPLSLSLFLSLYVCVCVCSR